MSGFGHTIPNAFHVADRLQARWNIGRSFPSRSSREVPSSRDYFVRENDSLRPSARKINGAREGVSVFAFSSENATQRANCATIRDD